MPHIYEIVDCVYSLIGDTETIYLLNNICNCNFIVYLIVKSKLITFVMYHNKTLKATRLLK
jgi:hypothetical protein